MKSFTRLLGVTLSLLFVGATTIPLTAAPAPAARSLEGLGRDLSDLESLVDHLEKHGSTWDDKQRASAYARLLALAENIGIGLNQQRQLLMTAIQSPPKNDPNGGLTKTVTSGQKARLAELNKLDERLRALRIRIAALDPSKKGGAGAGVGVGPTIGGARGTTPTVPGGSRK